MTDYTIYPWQQENYKHLLQISKNVPHTILLHGGSNNGLLLLSLIWIKGLLCNNHNSDNSSCNCCQSCILFTNNNHPDFIQLESKNGNTDQVRNIIEQVSLTPHVSSYKVILIKDVELLNINSANALLKVLEEPNSYTIFILLANNIAQLLPTILSRCYKYYIKFPTKEQAIKFCETRNINNSDFWLRYNDYDPLFNVEINDEQTKLLIDTLTTPSIENIYQLTTIFDGKNIKFNFILQFLYKWNNDLISNALTNKVFYFTSISLPKIDTDLLSIRRVFVIQDCIIDLLVWHNHPLNYKIHIENLLFKYQQLFVKSR
jgi:DNA polymerase-3 subunit delta'